MKKIFFVSLLGIMILIPLITLATGKGLGGALENLGQVTRDTGLSSNLQTSLGTVIKTALSLIGTVFLGLMIYAGILWMTAQGKEEKVTKAKDMITAAIIGLAITMSAYAITYFVTAKLTGVGGSDLGNGSGDGVQQCDGTVIEETGCYEFCEGVLIETCGYSWLEEEECVAEISVAGETYADNNPTKFVAANQPACLAENE